MSDTAVQYSESQILCGLRSVWPDMTGTETLFDSSTRLDEYMKADGSWDELDFADIFFRLEHFFGFPCTLDEWQELFGFELAANMGEWDHVVGPRLTFGALAQFIAERTDAIAIGPVTILGNSCRPAGAFRGIEKLAARCIGEDVRFGPSSRINQVLRGEHLDKFWTQLRWMTQNNLPELPALWRYAPRYGTQFGCLRIVLGGLCAWMIGGWMPLAIACVVAAVIYVAAGLYKQAANPLPRDIQSFRDLATMVAASDCDAVCGQG